MNELLEYRRMCFNLIVYINISPTACSAVPVAKGARVWVRINNMCFTRGVVTKDGHELHVVTTKGKLIRCPRDKPEFLAVDKIPNSQDVTPGSRVAAQWHDRIEPFYLATVQGRLGHNKYLLVFDDDDEGYCDLKNMRVLLWTASASGIDQPQSLFCG